MKTGVLGTKLGLKWGKIMSKVVGDYKCYKSVTINVAQKPICSKSCSIYKTHNKWCIDTAINCAIFT